MARTIIGIDPGMSGGIAVLRAIEVPDGAMHQGIYAMKMPVTDQDLLDSIGNEAHPPTVPIHNDAIAFVEKVNAGPKMGSSAAFKFGQNVAAIRMACLALNLRLEYVTPQKWQREFGLIVKGRGLGQGDTEKKNRNKARAQELFPGIKITHAIADALLIAEYGRRQNLTAPSAQE